MEGSRPPTQSDEHGELGHRARQGLLLPARRADEDEPPYLHCAPRRRDDRACLQGEWEENLAEEPGLLDVALRYESTGFRESGHPHLRVPSQEKLRWWPRNARKLDAMEQGNQRQLQSMNLISSSSMRLLACRRGFSFGAMSCY